MSVGRWNYTLPTIPWRNELCALRRRLEFRVTLTDGIGSTVLGAPSSRWFISAELGMHTRPDGGRSRAGRWARGRCPSLDYLCCGYARERRRRRYPGAVDRGGRRSSTLQHHLRGRTRLRLLPAARRRVRLLCSARRPDMQSTMRCSWASLPRSFYRPIRLWVHPRR